MVLCIAFVQKRRGQVAIVERALEESGSRRYRVHEYLAAHTVVRSQLTTTVILDAERRELGFEE